MSQSKNGLTELIDQSTPVPLSHHAAIARWHTDTRKPVHVVLLHGLYNSGDVLWNSFIKAVNDLPTIGKTPNLPIQLYALDLRDHGRSPHSDGAVSASTACADVAAFLKGPLFDGEKVFVVGHGFGGYVASVLGLAYPSLVAGVASLNASILKTHPLVHPGTLLSVGSPQNSNRNRSQLADQKVSAENAITFLKEIRTVSEMESRLESFFPDKLERESFMRSTLRQRNSDNGWYWACNVSDIGNFDIQRKRDAIDDMLLSGCVKNESMPYLRIHDTTGEFDSADSIRSLFPQGKTLQWDNFGGQNAETAMVLRRSPELSSCVLQHFGLLENVA